MIYVLVAIVVLIALGAVLRHQAITDPSPLTGKPWKIRQ